jgi:hypothetical protein
VDLVFLACLSIIISRTIDLVEKSNLPPVAGGMGFYHRNTIFFLTRVTPALASKEIH